MSRGNGFSISRWWSVVRKEFLQLRRDRLTFAMIVGIPIVQMTLFGYVINNDPRHLGTGIIDADRSNITRSFVWAMKNSTYFDVIEELPNEAAGHDELARGKVLFVVISRLVLAAVWCAMRNRLCWWKPMERIRRQPEAPWPL
jgi:ABC-2 type transport system permease protein